MNATEVLKTEHRAIERMLAIVEEAARRLHEGQDVDPDVIRSAIDFIRTFADHCHHVKEEDTLFPLLEERGMPRDSGPIGVMLLEHEEGRDYVRGMAAAVEQYAAGDKGAGAAIAENARGYVGLLRDHILKEDTILYPMADNVLSESDQEALVAKFDKLETEVIGEGVHERYHQLLDDLERQMGLV